MLVQSNQVRAYCADSTGLVPLASWYTDAGSTYASGTAAIINHSMPGGQGWWVDDVTVRRLVDAEPVVTQATRIYADTLDDWNRTYSHSASLTFNVSTPSIHDNDSSRVIRNTAASGDIAWYRPGVTAFRMAMEHWDSEAITPPTFAYSADGSSWTTVAASALNLSGVNWYRYEYTATGLPAGTNYVRITLTGTAGQTWAQQLLKSEFSY
jgi:hypothetical protein